MDYNHLLFKSCFIASFRDLFLFCFVCFSVGYRTKRNSNFLLIARGGLETLNYLEISIFGDGPKNFLTAPLSPIYTNFEGGERATKRDF